MSPTLAGKSVESEGSGQTKHKCKPMLHRILEGRVCTRRSHLCPEIHHISHAPHGTCEMHSEPATSTSSPAPGLCSHDRGKLPSHGEKAADTNAQTEIPGSAYPYVICSHKVTNIKILEARSKLLEKLGITPEQVSTPHCITFNAPKPYVNNNQNQHPVNGIKKSDQNGLRLGNEKLRLLLFGTEKAAVDVDLSMEGLKIDDKVD